MNYNNYNIYWDHGRGVVGITACHYDMRAEEPIGGRQTLTDGEVLALVDSMLKEAL